MDGAAGVSYPYEWKGSVDPDDTAGVAVFKIEGLEFSLRLEAFADCLMLDTMLDLAFAQGKDFAATIMRGRIERAMDDAEQAHALTRSYPLAPASRVKNRP